MAHGFVYFLRGPNNLVKIGKASKLDERIRNISPKLPLDVELLYSIETDYMNELEREVHIMFREQRIRGERFQLTDEHVNYIVNVGVLDGMEL